MIWDGLYTKFSDILDLSQINHAPDVWVEKSLKRLEAVRQDTPERRTFSNFSVNPLSILPAVLDLVSRGEEVVATDVGGNLGQLYFYLIRWTGPQNIRWTVVERKELLEHPRLAGYFDDSIQWRESLSDAPSKTNLLFFGSTLQYIENLDDDISPFLRRAKPKWVVIADGMVFAKDIPDFITGQVYYDGIFPSKFRNLNSLVNYFQGEGYRLIFEESSLSEFNLAYYPSDGLEPDRAMPYPLDLIFERIPPG